MNLLIEFLVNCVGGIIGNHSEEVELETLRRAFGQQHMCWPSTATETEGGELGSLCGLIICTNCTEGSLIWNCHTGLFGTTNDVIYTRINCLGREGLFN